MALNVLILVFILNNDIINGQQGQLRDYTYAPQHCDVWVRQPQSTTKNTIEWRQAVQYSEYYLFSKDLSGQDQVYHFVPPIANSDSFYYGYSLDPYVKMLYPMDPDSDIWMMAYWPYGCTSNSASQGYQNCPYSENNTTCTVHKVLTASPTSPTKSPTPRPTTKYPTRSPIPPPTRLPTENIITPSSTSSILATFQSTGTDYQNGIITCPALQYCYVYCDSADDCCDNLVIDASAATTLLLRCRNYDSTCTWLEIIKPPSLYANIYCSSERACSSANMDLSSLDRAFIDCSSSSAPNGFGPCNNVDYDLTGTKEVDVLQDRSIM